MLAIVLINLTVWLFICSLGAVGNYQDNLHQAQPDPRGFLHIFSLWINVHVPMFILSTSLYCLLIRFPHWIERAKTIIRNYVLLSVFFFPLHIVYISLPRWYRTSSSHDLSSLWHFLLELDNFTYFLEFAWFSGTYVACIAVRNWHQAQTRFRQLQSTQQANLELHLALEQQRMHSLRQQLEPHFIFNALNALSALIRTNERAEALHSVHSLSALLRYALNASKHNFVSLDDELNFLRDYMALQSLRYGSRLHFSIVETKPCRADLACPPLLLQPLVENALRHDLDCHEEEGKIEVLIEQESEQLLITVRNSLYQDRVRNPGLGIGQSQTGERLALLYGERASFECLQSESEYIARLRLPCEPLEAIDD